MSRSFISVGLGQMGVGVAQALIDRGWHCRGAVSHQVGDALGDVLDRDVGDLAIGASLEQALANPSDLCIIATCSMVEDIFDDVMLAVSAGLNVLSSSEELVYPWATASVAARELNEAASAAGVSVLGTGINPGFIMDVLPVFLTAACRSVSAIEVVRINDLSPFGPSVLRSFGVGLTLAEFESAWAAGTIAGHVGFQQSIAMISDALGLDVDRVAETVTPIVAKRERRGRYGVIPPGAVTGVRQEAIGYADGREVVRLLHPQQVDPHVEDGETVDAITITGDPHIDLQIRPEIPGGIGTVATMANSADALVRAPAGLLSPLDLPILYALPAGASTDQHGPFRTGRTLLGVPIIKHVRQANLSLAEELGAPL